MRSAWLLRFLPLDLFPSSGAFRLAPPLLGPFVKAAVARRPGAVTDLEELEPAAIETGARNSFWRSYGSPWASASACAKSVPRLSFLQIALRRAKS